jgi:DNA-binding NtrC family response regulator
MSKVFGAGSKFSFPKNPRLLIVEDEADIRFILGEQLLELQATHAELDISFAENGREALKLVEGQWFDAVVSDLNMPAMSGLEFLFELRQRELQTPVIFLTGFGDKAKAIEALRLGAFDFLDKPWNHQHLLSVTSEALFMGLKLRDLHAELAIFRENLQGQPEAQAQQQFDRRRALALTKLTRLFLVEANARHRAKAS